MRARIEDKARAIELRRQGLSYREILALLPISKSSLSEWVRDLPLTQEEKKYLKGRTDINVSRGRIKAATALRRRRIDRDAVLFEEAKIEFGRYVSEPFFLVGISLYWAEGTKRGNSFHFINSDLDMISTMVTWIEGYLLVPKNKISLRLFIHKPFAHERFEEYWAKHTGISVSNFKKTIYKLSNSGIKKRPQYKGCVRIELPNSTKYLRKMSYWQNMMIEHYREG
jgi:hypothetical protein